MAKAPKNNWLGGRVNEAFKKLVTDYVAKVDELDNTTLIELAVREYIAKHPVS